MRGNNTTADLKVFSCSYLGVIFSPPANSNTSSVMEGVAQTPERKKSFSFHS